MWILRRGVAYVDEGQSDSEDENDKIKPIVNNDKKIANDDRDTKEESTKLLHLDWSFLSAVLPSDECVS